MKSATSTNWKFFVKIVNLIVVAVSAIALSSEAAVTPQAWYRLGEDDSGAIAGNTGNAITTDSAASLDLTRINAPQYSSDVAPLAISTLSMNFGVPNSYRLTPDAPVTTLTQGVGMEVWVKANSLLPADANEDYVVYNGVGGANGYGFIQAGPALAGSYGQPSLTAGHFYAQLGASFIDLGVVPVGQWVHLGLTLDNGTGFATAYKNGDSLGTTNLTANTPGNFFSISSYTVSPQDEFNGKIDEVRFFSFQGAFNAEDFLIVPEPSTVALFGLGGLMLYRRRRKK